MAEDNDEMHVDPWTVKNINYDKLIDQFVFFFFVFSSFLSFFFFSLVHLLV